tara:strand:+ start:98 stop:796 length:699 start_codon:yes stop_codon:yes gene_type:complete
MAEFNLKHEWNWADDFIGAGTFAASAGQGDSWVITDTSSAGTPTYARVDLGEATVSGAIGSASLAFDSQTEAQNVCLSFGDNLAFDVDKVRGIEFRVKLGQAALDTATSIAFGLTGDRNDAIDSIAYAALFRVIGADDTTAVVVETDDGTNDNNDVATGSTLLTAWKVLKILFPPGNAAVTFWIDNIQVATATAFDMSNFHGGVQPFVQIQKTSDNNTDSIQIDYVQVWGVR